MCGLLARRYTHAVHLRRDALRGGTCGEGGYEYEEGEGACAEALLVTVGCQGIVTLPDTAHELGITRKPAHITYICMDDRVITSKPVPEMKYRGEPYPGMISTASTIIHPGRGSPALVSQLMSLMSTVV
jgi:hypothetical protein